MARKRSVKSVPLRLIRVPSDTDASPTLDDYDFAYRIDRGRLQRVISRRSHAFNGHESDRRTGLNHPGRNDPYRARGGNF